MREKQTKFRSKAGRPSIYQREYCGQIIETMANGLSSEAAAVKIGISARSLYNWQREYPEFMQAVQDGRQHALLWWETRALEMAQGSPGNAQLVMLALKNRSRAPSGWHHDSQKVEHSGPEGGPVEVSRPVRINVEVLTFEQRDILRSVLLAAQVGEHYSDGKSLTALPR